MKTGNAYWSVVHPIWETISIYDGVDRFLPEFAAAPTKARNLFAAHWCQSEICNGGFYQFFDNSTGILAPEAVNAFRALGMPKLAEIVSNAMSWFGNEYPRERQSRREALSLYASSHPEARDPFRELDDAFYGLFESENEGFLRAADAYAIATTNEQA
ncbi:MAG: DUF4375 domain-containing protein [Opitutales bacterium]